MRRMRTLLILLPVLLSTQSAHGHAMNVACNVTPPDRVVVVASWGDDEPVAQGAVTVFDINGDTILHGTTDVAGRFECSIAIPQALIVEVVFAGHRGECEIDAVRFEDHPGLTTPAATAMDETATHEHEPEQADANQSHNADAHHHDHDHAAEHTHSPGEAVDHHARAAASQESNDRHEHAGDDNHRVELASGIALILSAASFLMVLSLRREVKSLAAGLRKNRS